METARAKEILQAIHAGDSVVSREDCEAACALVERDTALQAWFEAELSELSELDGCICKKLKSVHCPDGAKEELKATLATASGQSPTRRYFWPALAAAAALVIGIFIVFPKGGNDNDKGDGELEHVVAQRSGRTLDSFRGDMVNFVQDKLQLHHKGDDLAELGVWLTAHGAPMGQLRDSVGSGKGMGCAVVEWGESKVSLICFRTTDDQVVHLFVAKRCAVDCDDLEKMIATDVEARGLHTAGWADGESLYLMVGGDSSVLVDQLL